MKKTVILFSFALCTLFLDSCSKDQDRTSTGTQSPSNTNGPAEDPYAEQIHHDGQLPQDSTSIAPDAGQSPDPSNETPGNALPEDNTTYKNKKVNHAKKDSVTSAAGQQGAGAGVGNGGSINAAQDVKKK
ncbi:MAG: hypothetical protein K0R51_3090 [Cytophagaceae bacterium]|jgi:hypothetical protein|nr:hypothetical protein [Cytophagaceae bacterium]